MAQSPSLTPDRHRDLKFVCAYTKKAIWTSNTNKIRIKTGLRLLLNSVVLSISSVAKDIPHFHLALKFQAIPGRSMASADQGANMAYPIRFYTLGHDLGGGNSL